MSENGALIGMTIATALLLAFVLWSLWAGYPIMATAAAIVGWPAWVLTPIALYKSARRRTDRA